MSEKPIYSPVPARAMGDPALSGADLRVLAAISLHDRFGKNGTGCFASHARLASITKLHPKAVARSVGQLRDAGYISSEKNPINGRLVVYRIIYNVADAATMRGDGRPGVRPTRLRPVSTGSSPVTDGAAKGSSVVTDNREGTGSSVVTDEGGIGNSPNLEVSKDQDVRSRNIFPERDNRLREASGSEGKASAAPPEVIADAERAAGAALSGEMDAREAVERLRRVVGRMRSYGDDAGERRARAMIDAVIADASRIEPRPARGLFPSPMESKAIREARESGEPIPEWVRPEVRGAA